VPLAAWKRAETFNTEYGGIRQKWAIPVWAESQPVGSVTAGQITINCDTLLRDLRIDSLAMLYNPDGAYEVVEIETLTQTSVNAFAPGLAADMSNAHIVPARVGFVVGDIKTKTNGLDGSATIRFQIDDNLLLVPAEPDQYLGDDIYFDAGLLGSGSVLVGDISQRQDLTDFALGPVEHRSPWVNARMGKRHYSILVGEVETRAYREFLYRRAGRFRRFWAPTFENDLRLKSTGAITTTIDIESDSFIDHAEIRTHFAFLDNAGTWHPRAISDPVQTDAETVTLTLDSSLGLDAENIAMVSYLGMNRLDNDRVQLTWIGGGVVKSTVIHLEVEP